jgi:ferredoxin-like protein FixX
MRDYEMWTFHGDSGSRVIEEDEHDYEMGDVDRMDEMLEAIQAEVTEEPFTMEVEAIFKLLKASEESLHEHTEVSLLDFITWMMVIKSKYFLSNNCYNDAVKLINDILLKPHKVPKDMYHSRKMMSALSLKYEKINICPNNCMLLSKEHTNKKKCLECGQSRFIEVVTQDSKKVMMEVAQKQVYYFPITSRLKRLFISKKITRHMRWHKEGIREKDGVIGHPSDGKAWKVLDRFDVNFVSDARNVHFGLATDGFDLFSTNSAPYTCWPIFVVPYNLPPSLCMKFEFMFLCLIIPGLKALGPRINVMLKPLIEELKQLWIGVEVYDCYRKQKFNLRATYLWSVHDFKAYDVFPGWSVHGELTCPICGSNRDCFRLTHGGKISYFDCHRDWLPRKHDFRQEQNVFRKDTTITKGPPKHLSDAQIVDMLDKLTPDPERPGYFEGYGETHN